MRGDQRTTNRPALFRPPPPLPPLPHTSHYHTRGVETQVNMGPGTLYLFMVNEDMTQTYFYTLKTHEMVTVPAGW